MEQNKGMKYIKPTEVRKLAHQMGKRVRPNFLAWLDSEVEILVTRHAKALGSKGTLNMQDAEALKALQRIRRK